MPSAKRNTYSVATMVGMVWTQGSVLPPATLGWGNATPTALLLLVEAPLKLSPREGTEKVPFFYDQNGKCLRFVTSLSANRLNKAKIDRK